MKERLPIWLQACLLFLLSVTLVGTLWWLFNTDQALQREFRRARVQESTYNIIYYYMTPPILFLGLRFCFGFVRRKKGQTASDLAFVCVGVLAMLPVLYVLLAKVLFPVQRVREMSGWA